MKARTWTASLTLVEYFIGVPSFDVIFIITAYTCRRKPVFGRLAQSEGSLARSEEPGSGQLTGKPVGGMI